MANVKVQWVLPTTRESGKPLDPADIDHVRIEVSADGGVTFGLIGDFGPNELEADVNDLDFGTWVFRGLVADSKGRVSQPMFGSIVIEDTTAPGALESLTVSLV